MILYFNKNGQLLEQLEYGAKPRVGMTTFQIFAYFEGIDLDNYGAALIRFKRPDLQGSEYPNLFMKRVQINYHANIESSGYYKEINNPYDGYIFNFNTVRDDDTNAIVQMLDTPGIWEASITLVNSGNGRNVTGLIRFTVGGAVSDADEDMTILSEAVIENNVISAIASKVDQNSLYYARIVDNLAESVADHDVFLKTVFKVNAVVYDKATNSCYTITAVTPVDENGDADEDGDYVTIDAYQKIEGVLPSVSISNSAKLQDLFNKLNLAYGTGQTQKVAFILNNAYLGYAETFGGVLVNFHFLSLSSNLSYSKVVEETSLNSITVGEVFTIANTTIIFNNRSNLIPKEDNYYNLGANDKKWAHAYISEIDGVDNIYDSNNNSYLRSGRSLLGMGADLDLDLGSATYYWNNVYAQHLIDKDGNDWHVEDGNPYFNSHKIVVDTDLNDYATVAYVDSKIMAVYRYRGSVPTYADLPSSDLTIGDVYNVEDSGDNYAWTGTEWDRLGGNISIDNMMTTDTSQIVTGQKEFRYDMSGGLTNHTRTIIDGWGIEMQRFSDVAYTTPQGKLLKFGATYEHVDPFITFGSYTIEFPEKSGRLVVDTDNANVLKSGSATVGQALTADGDGGTTWSDIPPSGIQEISIQGTDTFAQIKTKARGLNFFGFEHPFGGGRHYAIIDNINSQFIVLYKNGYSSGAYSDSMTYTTWNTNASFVRYLTSDTDLAQYTNSNVATSGQVLTANGSGGASWLDAVNVVEFSGNESLENYAGRNIVVKWTSNNQYYLLSVKENVANVNYTARAVPLNESTLGFYYASGFASLTFTNLINSTYLKTAMNSNTDLATQSNSGSAEAGLALESDGSNGAEWSAKLPYANMSQQGSVTLAELPIERPFLMYFTNQYVNGYFWSRIESLGNSYAFYFEAVQGHGIYKSSSLVAGTTTLDSILTGTSSPYYVVVSNVSSGAATSGQVLTADGSGGSTWSDIKKLYKHTVKIRPANAPMDAVQLEIINNSGTQFTITDFMYNLSGEYFDTDAISVKLYLMYVSSQIVSNYNGNLVNFTKEFSSFPSKNDLVCYYWYQSQLNRGVYSVSNTDIISDTVVEL